MFIVPILYSLKELNDSGGVSQVEMLNRTNLVAIIGSGTRTKFSNNKGGMMGTRWFD